MKKNHLISIVVIALFASLVGCTPSTTPPAPVADTPGAENTPTPEPYKVELTPADFVSTVDNAYFPLIPGSKWVYETKLNDGSTEEVEIEVLQEKREIMGVQATVVHDTVHMEGQIVEDTIDWYAQDKDGNVWYLGETVGNYEDGVLVDHQGSWEWGVDGALPGVVMWADPAAHVNEVYRQEYYVGEAEDQGKVLSVNESVTVPFGSFENVVKTYDFSSLDPDLQEEKYYAEGIGNIKTDDLTTGEEEVLIEFTPGGPGGETAAEALPTAPESERVDLIEPTFSNPSDITNPLFPASLVTKTLLLGHVDGQPLHVEYTLLPETKIIEWNGQKIETVEVQYVAHLNGRIEEVALDWYAQADDGSVWYFGEDVSNFEDGAVADKEGTWLAGKDGPAAMIMPANPQVGDVYRVENIPGVVFEEITIQATGVTVEGPHGPIQGAMIGDQLHVDGAHSNKTFAPGYGEFVTIKGSELEALALAVPTDALSTPTPPELETLSKGAANIFDEAQSEDWDAAASSLSEMIPSWDTLQKGNVPFMLDAQMSEALTALIGAVNARQPLEARFAALNVANAGLDIQLQYRPAVEIELARLNLLAQQVQVDVEAEEAGWVKSDVTTLELTRDRVAHLLDKAVAADLDALLANLRSAADQEDLEASAEIAPKLLDLFSRLEPAG